MPTMMEIAPMTMAQVPKFDPRLLATIPTMIPTIPKMKGIVNKDIMEMIKAMTPIAFPLDATSPEPLYSARPSFLYDLIL